MVGGVVSPEIDCGEMGWEGPRDGEVGLITPGEREHGDKRERGARGVGGRIMK